MTAATDAENRLWQEEPQDPASASLKAEIPSLTSQRTEFATPEMVTVVIPTLNEKDGIGQVLDELKEEGYTRVLVVDGYSEDGTVEIARSKGAVAVRQHGVGKAGALRTAIGLVETPFMVVMDGDFTYKAKDIRNLMTYAPDYDEVIGARTSGRENISLTNRLGNWLISKTYKLLFGTPISDVLSGMYLLRTEKVREIDLTAESFDIEVEIASGMASAGNVTQVPISYGERLGQKKLKTYDASRIISTLIWMANYYNPVILYGGIGSLAAIPAAGILLWVMFEGLFLGVWHSTYAILGMGLFLLASQAAAISLTSLMLRRSERRLLHEIRRDVVNSRTH